MFSTKTSWGVWFLQTIKILKRVENGKLIVAFGRFSGKESGKSGFKI
jgi:hypothetical protein